jgi:hypothetical protein
MGGTGRREGQGGKGGTEEKGREGKGLKPPQSQLSGYVTDRPTAYVRCLPLSPKLQIV